MDTQFSEAKKHSYYINMGIKTLMEVNFSKVQTYIFYTRTKSNKQRPYQCVKCRYILEYTITHGIETDNLVVTIKQLHGDPLPSKDMIVQYIAVRCRIKQLYIYSIVKPQTIRGPNIKILFPLEQKAYSLLTQKFLRLIEKDL